MKLKPLVAAIRAIFGTVTPWGLLWPMDETFTYPYYTVHPKVHGR